MRLLVDGYNVLYTDMPVNLAGLDEARLCWLLSRSVWSGGQMTVVCDGSVKPHGPSQSPVGSVNLVYSGPNRSADEVMVDAIQLDSAPRRLIVVSSDRQIQKAARRRRCQILDSTTFVHRLAKGARGRKKSTVNDGTGEMGGLLDSREVNQWLEQFGFNSRDHRGGPDDSGSG